jgi:hypothetical protein
MSNTLTYTLLGIDKLSPAFQNASKNADALGKKSESMGSRLGTAAGKVAAGGVLALGAAFVSGVKSAAAYEVLGKKTEAVIKSTGNVAGISVKGVQGLASSLENMSGVDEELIINSQNVLATFTAVRNEAGKGNAVFNQGTKAALDMSVALGTDLQSATMLVGKALNDPIRGTTALRRAGVQLTKQQEAQIRTMVESGDVLGAQKIILGELQTQFGGTAKAAGDTFAGKLNRAMDAAGDLAREAGEVLLPILGAGADLLTSTVVPAFAALASGVGDVVEFFADLPAPIQIGIGVLTAGAVVATQAATAYRAVSSAVQTLYLKFLLLSTGAKIMIASLGAIGFALAIAATAVELFGGESEETKAKVKAHTDALNEQTGALTDNSRALAHAALEEGNFAQDAERAGISQKLLTDAALGTKDAYQQLGRELRVAVDAGKISEIQAIRILNAVTEESGVVADSREAWKRKTEAQGKDTEASKANKEAVDKQSKSMKELIEDHRKLAGEVLGSREAQRRYQEATDAARASIKENGRTLDINTAKGRANQSALDAVANAALDQAEALRANHAPADLIRKKMETARAEFVRVATKMGLSEKAAKKLADKLLDIPGTYKAAIEAETKRAHDKVRTFLTKDIASVTKRFKSIIDADTTPGRNKITKFIKEQQARGIVLSTEGKFLGFTGGGYRPPMKAAGGPIYGPGTSTSDSIPAWLSDGEFVVKASSYRKHRALVEAINADKVPGFAKGGAAVKLPVDVNMSGWLAGVNAMIKKFAESSGGPGIAGALNWARSQVGKPYVWGGVGPGGYDCSGFMSAIVNKIRGRNPYSRLGSTATFPWGGFSPGVGPFMIGSSRNTGFGIGHMAGTLGGVNVESRGGDGVVVGGSARGARSGMFGGPYALRLAMGGVVGDPPWDQLDPRGKYYGKLLGSFAAGTRYVERTGAYELHRGEAVTPAAQNVPADAREWAREFAKELKRQGIAVIPAGRQADLIMRSG